MSNEKLNKEQQILRVMRKILTNVVRETTPNPGEAHPLTEATFNEIRLCLGLISERERELLVLQDQENRDRPYFSDDPNAPRSAVVTRIDAFKKP